MKIIISLLLFIFSINIKCQSHLIFKQPFAEIKVANNSSTQTVTAGSYNKVTCFNTNGWYHDCIANVDSDRIEILITGIYRISSNFSTKASLAGVTFTTAFFVNNTELVNEIHAIRRWINANDNSSASMNCQVQLTKGQYVDVRTKHDNGSSVDIIVSYGNFNVEYIGD